MKEILIAITVIFAAACGPDSFDPSTPPVNRKNTDDPNDQNDDLEKKPTPSPTVAANFCGDGLNLGDTSLPLSEKVFKLDPFTKTFKKINNSNSSGINTLINFSGNLVLQNSPASVIMSQGLLAIPNLNQPDMKSFLADAKARLEATTIPYADRSTTLSNFPLWTDKSNCVLQPVTQLTKSGELPLSISFNQPIPFAVSPIDNLASLIPLLKSNTVWSDITATILKSSDPKLAVGKSFLGSVSVDKTLDNNSPNLTSIKISYNFGGLANNKIMGLPLSAVWTVDSVTKEIVSIEIDSGIGKTIRFIK